MVMAGDSDHPTVLIVHRNDEFRTVLGQKLLENGYLVLETQNTLKTLVIGIRHSRRIHFLLADDSDDSRDLAATLKPFRPDMNVIHVSSYLELNSVLMEVSQVPETYAHAFEDRESAPSDTRAILTVNVDKARRHFLESVQHCLEITKNVPSTIPHLDGVARLQRLADSVRRAFDKYLKARQKLEDYSEPTTAEPNRNRRKRNK
jgi:hypothetical protein